MTLRVGLVGAGAMGSNHARTIDADPLAELATVVDTERERATELASRYGSLWTSDVANLDGVDAVVVATPAEAHTRIALDLLERRIPVLVEKPASTDPFEVAAMVETARLEGVGLQVGFVERFNPVVRTAMELLEVHGPALHVMSTRHSPPNPRISTSVVYDLLIHDIDLAMRLTGSSDVRRHSGSCWSNQGLVEISDVTGVTESGAIFTLSASRVDQRKIRELRVVTESALFEMDLLRRTMTVYRHVAQSSGIGPAGYQAQTLIDIPFIRQEGEPLALQWRAFRELAEGRVDPEPTLASIEAPHVIAAVVEQSDGVGAPAADSQVPERVSVAPISSG